MHHCGQLSGKSAVDAGLWALGIVALPPMALAFEALGLGAGAVVSGEAYGVCYRALGEVWSAVFCSLVGNYGAFLSLCTVRFALSCAPQFG